MASTITTSVVTGGSNSHATTASDVNALATDFLSAGCVGTLTNTSGVAPNTGSFAVNAQGTPAMFVDVTAGQAWITATPSGQSSQKLRANMTANYTSYAISANTSGSTKYDWIYLSVDATKANAPAADASDVTALYTSRSSLNTADNGTPPTYGILLAVVTVANGASSITNGSISDRRVPIVISQTNYKSYFAIYDFVESGCVWSGDSYGSTLAASMTSGFAWIGGNRVIVSAVTARAFTANKDTYIDLSDAGNGTASVTYTEVTNNAASPALSAGSVRIGIIVSGATSIAAVGSVNQGQETKILPIASSVPYAVTDSLGNLICPRDPNRKILGYRQAIADQTTTTTGTTGVQITGLTCPVIVPTARKIKITVYIPQGFFSGAAGFAFLSEIWDGVVGSGTQLMTSQTDIAQVSTGALIVSEVITTPTTASKTYNGAFSTGSATATAHTNGAAAAPLYIKVELV